MADEPNITPQTEEQPEKTFTQAEVDALVSKRVARAMKGVPSDGELTEFRKWKQSRNEEQEKNQTLINERDEARNELIVAHEELETAKRAVYLMKKGLTGEEAEFFEFRAMKMTDENTTFEKAVDKLLDERKPRQKVDFTASLTGGDNDRSVNGFMNDLIRNAKK